MIEMRVAYLLIFLISIAVYSYIPNIYSQQYYWNQNDHWSYNVTVNGTLHGTREVVVNKISTYQQQTVFEILDNITLQETTNALKIYMSLDLKRIHEESRSDTTIVTVDYSPYVIFVNLQNNQVKDWTSNSNIIITTTSTQTTTTSSGNVILNAKVSGTEIVNLPAGKFSAFKIHVFQNVTIYYSEGDVTSRYTIIQNGTAWYSTQVKQYIKEDIISTTIAYYSNSTEQSQISYLSELKSYSIQQQITSPTTSSPTTSTTSPTSSSPTFTFTKTGSQTSSPTTILSSTPFSYNTSKQPSSPPIFTTSELTIFGLSMFNFILIIAGVIIAIALAGLLLMRRRKGAQPKEIYPTQPPPPQPPQYTPQPIQYPAQQTQAQQYQTQPQHQVDVTQQAQPPQQSIPSTKVCPYCNSILPAEAKFCAVCGNPQPK